MRVDEVADGFGLGEIEAAVEEGAHSEFAGFGETRAAGECEFDDVTEYDGRAVGRDFNDVVGGVGMGLLEIGDDDFVDAAADLRHPLFRLRAVTGKRRAVATRVD